MQEKGWEFSWRGVWICSALPSPPIGFSKARILQCSFFFFFFPGLDQPHASSSFQFRVTRDPKGMGPDPSGGYCSLYPFPGPLPVQVWALQGWLSREPPLSLCPLQLPEPQAEGSIPRAQLKQCPVASSCPWYLPHSLAWHFPMDG